MVGNELILFFILVDWKTLQKYLIEAVEVL